MPDPLNISIAGQETSFRPSDALYAELAARGPSLPAVIKRDLARYYQTLHWEQPTDLSLQDARALYDRITKHPFSALGIAAAIHQGSWNYTDIQLLALLDATERVHELVTRHDMPVDDALVQVGLVKE